MYSFVYIYVYKYTYLLFCVSEDSHGTPDSWKESSNVNSPEGIRRNALLLGKFGAQKCALGKSPKGVASTVKLVWIESSTSREGLCIYHQKARAGSVPTETSRYNARQA